MERSSIHLLHKRGKSLREIARALGHDRKTVARALAEPVDRQPTTRRRASHVDPYREQIAQWVGDGLTAVRMLELARGDPERPYPGGHAVFRAAVRAERLAQSHAQAVTDVPVRFEGLPAEYLQIDWGEIRAFPFTHPTHQSLAAPSQPAADPAAEASTTRYFLACRLKYSRWMWVRFTTEMRQETLFRGLVDCFVALGFVPWVLVFDNMRTVTSGRDPQRQPIWSPALLQLAAECGFHPEACTPGAANQKGSVESLVRFVKGNFLAGRDFRDDDDLAAQSGDWLASVNARASQATDVAPIIRLPAEAARGGALPATADDYGFAHSGRVSPEALVAVLGNQYSVPITHVGAPVTVRVHRVRIVIWRDTESLAEHPRAPDGAHRRVVEPAHYALLFTKKPRAQVMLYRQALIDLGETAQWYVSELSHRRRGQLREEILGLYALYAEYGAVALLAAMAAATKRGAYGTEYLRVLLAFRQEPPAGSLPPAPPAPSTAPTVVTRSGAAGLPGMGAVADLVAPRQEEIDRQLDLYEAFVWTGSTTSNGEVPGAPRPAPGEEPGATAHTMAAAEVVR